MEAFLVSAGAVALAEMGDKTQLLALTLAARWRKPVPIILGILVATLLNHGAAGWAGSLIAEFLTPQQLRWAVGLSFIAMGAWTLVPDKLDDAPVPARRLGVFAATAIAFFIVEIGDKTQIATVALAARYADLLSVVLGTTLGMMLANVPVVLLGNFAAGRLPLKAIRIGAALLFVALGLVALLDPGA
jgi:putative Ca2+/H+ antiporter (TMEM165/GDT1 family)